MQIGEQLLKSDTSQQWKTTQQLGSEHNFISSDTEACLSYTTAEHACLSSGLSCPL